MPVRPVPNYLRECLERHGDVTYARYGESQKLQEIEKLAGEIANTGHLTYNDLKKIIDADLWSGGTFWQWPTRAQFDERCAEHGFDDQSVAFWYGTQPTITKLLKVFRHIGPVSVVLRFIEPKDFGILSPPVEKILEIGPAHKPRDKYLNYVYDLRRLRDQRGFEKAAEVDMALWVMQEVIAAKNSRSDWLATVVPEHDRWIQAFWADEALRNIRVRNLTKSLFDTMRLPEIAEALLPPDDKHPNRDQDQVHLCARIAAVEFGLAVVEGARRTPAFPYEDLEGLTLSALVSNLELPGSRERWGHAVRLRNAAVHDGRISRDDVKELLDCMRDAIVWAGGLASPRE